MTPLRFMYFKQPKTQFIYYSQRNDFFVKLKISWCLNYPIERWDRLFRKQPAINLSANERKDLHFSYEFSVTCFSSHTSDRRKSQNLRCWCMRWSPRVLFISLIKNAETADTLASTGVLAMKIYKWKRENSLFISSSVVNQLFGQRSRKAMREAAENSHWHRSLTWG